MNEILDKSFDAQFDKIEELTWYPWVGKDYKNGLRRVLFIGTSHYCVDENKKYDPECYDDFMSDKQKTRDIVRRLFNGKTWNMFRNLESTFPDSNRNSFWSKIAFYNFFPKPDEEVSGNKYPKEKHLEAWNLWRKIIEILQPDICIFLGIGLSQYYEQWNEAIGKDAHWRDIQTDFCKKGQRPPILGRFDITSTQTANLLFINHPSSRRGYSPDQWHDFLKQQLPEAMEWLNTK